MGGIVFSSYQSRFESRILETGAKEILETDFPFLIDEGFLIPVFATFILQHIVFISMLAR